MLPIRLGTVNSNGPQELVAFLFSPKGRIETTNYRTVKMPADVEIPMYIHKQKKFGEFYKAVFDKANQDQNGPVVFLEHSSSLLSGRNQPLSAEDAQQLGMASELGVNWFRGMNNGNPGLFHQAAQRIHVTRLHVRYTADTFPEDLMFQETGDRGGVFFSSYTIRHPWEGGVNCADGRRYKAGLPARHEQQAQNLARITGWDINKIRTAMGHTKPAAGNPGDKWWKNLWKD
jgi:hypothetical protein